MCVLFGKREAEKARVEAEKVRVAKQKADDEAAERVKQLAAAKKREEEKAAYAEAHDESGPITAAQHFVKTHLKAPSSASFPWLNKEYKIDRGLDGKCSVSGSVEAINSFNAKLRTTWSVDMKKVGDQWQLDLNQHRATDNSYLIFRGWHR